MHKLKLKLTCTAYSIQLLSPIDDVDDDGGSRLRVFNLVVAGTAELPLATPVTVTLLPSLYNWRKVRPRTKRLARPLGW